MLLETTLLFKTMLILSAQIGIVFGLAYFCNSATANECQCVLPEHVRKAASSLANQKRLSPCGQRDILLRSNCWAPEKR